MQKYRLSGLINMEFIADVKKNVGVLKKLAPTTKKLKAQK